MRNRPAAILGASIALLVASTAGAQAPPGLEGVSPDTLVLTIGLRVPSDVGIAGDLNEELLLLTNEIANAVEPPNPWQFPLWPHTHLPRTATIGAEGYLAFRVSANGKLKSATFTGAKGAPGLREALFLALRRLESAGELASPVPGQDTTVVLEVATVFEPRVGFFPIGRIRAISWEVDSIPAIDKMPDLPATDRIRRTRSSSGVILEFVVDEKGRIDRNTIEVLLTDDEAFAKTSIDRLAHAKFHPAMAQNIPVRVLVRQQMTLEGSWVPVF